MRPCRAQAFDDCTTLTSTFKLLDSFEGLLEREAIAAELAKKQARAGARPTWCCACLAQRASAPPTLHPPLHTQPPTTSIQAELVKAFAADISEVAELFEAAKAAPALAHNAPPHAGAVAWVRGLKARLAEPFAKLAAKEGGALLEGREGRAASAAYAKVMAAMDAFEAAAIEAWVKQARTPSSGFPACLNATPARGCALWVHSTSPPNATTLTHVHTAPPCARPARWTRRARRSSTCRCSSSTPTRPLICRCWPSTSTPSSSRCCARPSTSCCWRCPCPTRRRRCSRAPTRTARRSAALTSWCAAPPARWLPLGASVAGPRACCCCKRVER